MKQISKIIVLNCWKRQNEGKIVKKLIEQAIAGMGIDVEISYDNGSLGVWKNYIQALRIPSAEPERFRLIIHDDLVITRQSFEKMLHILQFVPDDSYASFYDPDNSGYREAKDKGHRVLKTHTNFWTQAFCFPANRSEEFIKWSEENIDPKLRWEDRRIQHFSSTYNYPIYAFMPSMFQHLGAYRSTMGFAGKIGKSCKRYSAMFDPEADVKSVDWKTEILTAYKNEMHLHEEEIHKNTIAPEDIK